MPTLITLATDLAAGNLSSAALTEQCLANIATEIDKFLKRLFTKSCRETLTFCDKVDEIKRKVCKKLRINQFYGFHAFGSLENGPDCQIY